MRASCLRPASAAAVLACFLAGTTAWAGPLNPATFIDTSSGLGIASSRVDTGHAIFEFNAISGELVSVGVLVTEILPGTGFTDDDSMVFLFDSSGKLLAFNDDTDPLESDFQSLIESFPIQVTGSYFVGVTTYDNNPILDANGRVIGWEDDGESSIVFDLYVLRTLNAVPEPSSWMLLAFGGLGITGTFCRRHCGHGSRRIEVSTTD